MASVVQRPRPQLRGLLANSGQARPLASFRADLTTTLLGIWFVLGLFLDAWAHANVPQLETFFTPWHAVFYSGFAATGAWILWLVWRNVQDGRTGLAAVPVGYGLTMVALPVFAVSGFADYLWHTLLGIEKTIDIFFSPSHLGLITSMVVILTSPLRSAWANPEVRADPSMRRLLPAVLTTAFATTLVLLFLDYGNALVYNNRAIVTAFSVMRSPTGIVAGDLAVDMFVSTVVLLAPLLLLARKWRIPRGTATLVYTASATLAGALTGFENLTTLFSMGAAGLCVDLLAAWLRPNELRRNAYWLFAALASFVTWTLYLGVASVTVGKLPAVPELWTGAPLVAALTGWLFAALMLPSGAGDDRR